MVDHADVRCSVDAEHLGELVATLGSRGVESLTCQPPTLEELFLARYQAQPDAGDAPGASGAPRAPRAPHRPTQEQPV